MKKNLYEKASTRLTIKRKKELKIVKFAIVSLQIEKTEMVQEFVVNVLRIKKLDKHFLKQSILPLEKQRLINSTKSKKILPFLTVRTMNMMLIL